MVENPIKVGDGLVSQLKSNANCYSKFPSSESEFMKTIVEIITPTKEEIKAQQQLKEQQANNFKYFTRFKAEIIDMLSTEDKGYFISAMLSAINGIGIVGSRHLKAIAAAEKLSDKYGYTEDWLKDSMYAKSLKSVVNTLF